MNKVSCFAGPVRAALLCRLCPALLIAAHLVLAPSRASAQLSGYDGACLATPTNLQFYTEVPLFSGQYHVPASGDPASLWPTFRVLWNPVSAPAAWQASYEVWDSLSSNPFSRVFNGGGVQAGTFWTQSYQNGLTPPFQQTNDLGFFTVGTEYFWIRPTVLDATSFQHWVGDLGAEIDNRSSGRAFTYTGRNCSNCTANYINYLNSTLFCDGNFAGPFAVVASLPQPAPQTNGVSQVGDTQVQVIWAAVPGSGPVTYQVFRSPGTPPAGKQPTLDRLWGFPTQLIERQYPVDLANTLTLEGALVTQTTSTQFLDTPPASGGYTYWVRVKDSCFASPSASLVLQKQVGPLHCNQNPATLTASQGDFSNQVVLAWTAAPDATNYVVWRSPGNLWLFSRLGATATLQFADTTAQANQRYVYMVTGASADCGVYTGGGATTLGWVRYLPPQLTGVSPAAAPNDRAVQLSVSGTGLVAGASITLSRSGAPDLVPAQPAVVSFDGTQLAATFDLTGVSPGQWNVVVANFGSAAVLTNAFTVQQGYTTVYANGFDTPPGNEWSNPGTTNAPSGEKFLGEFGSQTVTLSLSNLPPHTKLRLDVNVLVLKTWDGNGDSCCGPDTWQLDVPGGPTLLKTSFSNTGPGNRQAYPQPFPFGSNPAHSGAAAVNSLGYSPGGDSTYDLVYEFPHSASNIVFRFTGSLTEPLTNESWGLDNIIVRVANDGATPLPLPQIDHQVFVWTGVVNTDPNNWDNPGNWSPLGVPSGTAIAVINNATVNASGSHSLYRVDLSSGTLNVTSLFVTELNQAGGSLNGNLILDSNSGLYNWSGGQLAGSLLVSGGAQLNVLGGNDHDLPNCTVTNNGTITWTGGRIRGGGNGTQFFNYGLWDVQTDSEINADFGGNGVAFHNRGTFAKSAGANTAIQGGVLFENNATVDVETNALVFNNGGLFQNGCRFVGAGTALMANGNFTASGTLLCSNLVQVGGTLAGTNVLTGVYYWQAGNWNNADATAIASNAVLQIQSGADHDFPNCVLTNFGTVVWAGGRIRGGGNGTVIYNFNLWDVQNDADMNSDFGGNGVTFNNWATFRKSGGTNTTAIQGGVTVVNNATLDIETNFLSFNAGAVFQDGSRYVGGGTTLLSGQTFSVNGTILSSNLVQVGGTLAGTNVLTGVYQWNAGNWNSSGATTIGSNAVLVIQTTADHDMSGHAVTNLGTVTWTGGRIRGGGNGTLIVNLGLWDDRLDAIVNADFGGNGVLFNNRGTLLKSGGTGSSFLQNGVTLNNSGTLDVESGTFVINGGGLSNGKLTTGGSGTLDINSNFTLNSGSAVTGVNIVLTAGTLNGTWTGPLNWVNGSLGGTIIVPTNATLNIVGGADHDMPNCTLTNYGTVAWSGGRVRGGGNGTLIYNYNLWDAQTDSEINANLGGNGVTFNNWATFRKSGGTNTTAIQGGVNFINSATVEVWSNYVAFNAGATFQEGSRYVGAGTNLLAGGFFSWNGSILSSNLVQVGGTLTGSNYLTGLYVWSSGDWNSAGVTIIGSNGVLQVVSGADHDMSGHIVTNFGTVVWTGGRIRGGGNGTQIYNLGTWDAEFDAQFNADFGGNGVVFNNAGLFRKSAGGSNAFFQGGVKLNNTGTLDTENGTVVVNGGGVNGGVFSTASGATLDLNSSYTLNPGSTFTGPGAVLTAGTLTGTWAGTLTWTGGDLGGITVIPANGTLTIAGSNDHDMPNCTLTNLGNILWTGGRVRGGGNGTQIYNAGTWNDQVDSTVNSDFGGNGFAIYNSGTFLKSAGTNVTTLAGGVSLSNTGTWNVQSGTVAILGGGASSALFKTAAGATLNFGFNYTFNPGTTFTGAGAVLTAGAFSGTWSGPLSWAGGQLAGTVLIPASGILNIVGGNDHDMPSCTLTNSGMVAWSGGRIRGGGNGTLLVNLGLWDGQGDLTINADFGGNGVTFQNNGTLRKSAGVGATTLNGGVLLNNAGTVDVQTGVLNLAGGFSLAGGTLNFGISGPANFGQISFGSAVPFTGTLSVSLLGGFVPASGATFTLASYPAFGGAFTATTFPGQWQVQYGTQALTVTVVSASNPPVIHLRPPVLAAGQVQLDFALVSGAASSFTLLSSAQVKGPWNPDTHAVLTTLAPGQLFRFTTAASGTIQFYRVQSP